MPRNVLKS